MNFISTYLATPVRRIACLALLSTLGGWTPASMAALTDLSNEPLATLVTNRAKPNILFILDNSGSMGFDYMPDDVKTAASSYTSTYGYKSAQCNGVAYDPTYTYEPPVKADGSSYPAAVFTAAMPNGYTPKPPTYGSTYASSSAQTTTISGANKTFRFADAFSLVSFGGSGVPNWANGTVVSIEDPNDPTHWMIGSVVSSGAIQCSGIPFFGICLFGNNYRDVVINVTQVNGSGATGPWGVTAITKDDLTGSTYYKYTGSEPKMGWTYGSTGVKDTLFKRECISHPGLPALEDGDGKFTAVVLTATSPEAQNYANWYQYYRTRMLMTRSGAGRAFQPLTNRYRVGFTTINDTDIGESSSWTDIQAGQAFLHVKDFDSAQRSAFIDRLYNTDPNGGTPLRAALSKAGRYYSGKLTGQTAGSYKDPVQYACQRNYAFLSTDGYWNDSSNPKQLNGSTDIGQQDAADIRPFTDSGAGARTTVVTQTDRKETVTPVTTSQVYQRTVISYDSARGTRGCGSTRWAEVATPQNTTTTSSGSRDLIQDLVTTTTTVDSYNAGTLTSSTSVSGPSATTVSDSTPTPPAPTGSATYVDTTPVGITCVSTQKTGTALIIPPAKYGGLNITPMGADATVTLSSTTSEPVITVTGGSGGVSNTLADVAEYYYMTDLRTTALGNCTAGLGGSGDVCDNTSLKAQGADTALWQHMSTYTLGLGVNGTLAYDRYYLDHATDPTSTYYQLIKGTVAWPVPSSDGTTTIDDLWHAAVNGRGRYFGANNATDLKNALKSALDGMGNDPGVGAAPGVTSIKPVAPNNLKIESSYVTGFWSGNLIFKQVQSNGTESAPLAGTGQAGVDKLAWRGANTSDTRSIYYRKPGTTTLAAFNFANLNNDNLGASFINFCSKSVSDSGTVYPLQCNFLTAAQKTLANDGTNLVNWLRGHVAYEETNTTNPLYRSRTTALGDLIGSGPKYVAAPNFPYSDTGYSAFKTAQASRKPMVYVGGNDGMLHAFSADLSDLGTEVWAFVPTAVMPNLYRLANTDYSNAHQYSVDGNVEIADVQVGGVWKTILIGGLNGGGKAIYALDITSPTSPRVLWEFTDADLGYTYGKPLVVKRANGTWVVVFGSGYNNTGNGYLYVRNAYTGAQEVAKIPTYTSGTTPAGTAGTPSGLSGVTAWVDSLQDNTARRFYAGDLLGNVWRFDIDNLVAPNGQAQRLAYLQVSGVAQPIQIKPHVAEVNQNGVKYAVVVIATGRYLGVSDVSNTTQQSIYGIKDPLTASDWGNVRNNGVLVTQTMSLLDSTTRTTTSNAVSWSANAGWRTDLPAAKERTTAEMLLQYTTLVVGSGIPGVGNLCTAPGGTGWLTYIDVETGGLVDGASDSGKSLSGIPMGLSWQEMADGTSKVLTSDGPITVRKKHKNDPTVLKRAYWRELFNN